MNFAKKFIKNNPINISYINKSNELLSLQYKILAPKFINGGIVRVPHSYSNKHDYNKLLNTIQLLNELFKNHIVSK